MKYFGALIVSFLVGVIFHTLFIACLTILDMLILVVRFIIWPFVGLYTWCVRVVELWDHLKTYKTMLEEAEKNPSSSDIEPNNETKD